jgi:hypothetical protein
MQQVDGEDNSKINFWKLFFKPRTRSVYRVAKALLSASTKRNMADVSPRLSLTAR